MGMDSCVFSDSCSFARLVVAGWAVDVGTSGCGIQQQHHGMVAERSKAPGSGTPELANLQDFLVSVMGREFESHPCHKAFAVWAC
jgi:hypothetical protein